MIILCGLWIKKKDYFPLKESSPITLVLFCVCNTIYILAFPLIYFLPKDSNTSVVSYCI